MNDQFEDFKEKLPSYVSSEADFKLYKIRHSAEHVLTQALQRLYGKDSFRMAMGPATAQGFYLDLEPLSFEPSEELFEEIEKEMQKIIDEDLQVSRKDISIEKAKKLFKGNPYKEEWINEFAEEGKSLTVYWTGDEFVDLCSGPHIDSTKEIKAFKLLSIAGAYWRGDEKNKMLVRIYGTAFPTPKELRVHLKMLEEAKKRDHRKLAKELDLIVYSDLVGAGLPMYTPRGFVLRNEIFGFSRELNAEAGYPEVHTPNFNRADLFKTSGHYDKFKDDMFRVVSQYSDEEMFIKPMNCPQHTQLYASKIRSYKDLPIRYADFANLGRDEKPGEIHGILRSRVFAQDDGHAFVTEDQIADEFKNVLNVVNKALDVYQMKYWIRLSLSDPAQMDKYIGDKKTWEKSEKVLRDLLDELGVEYKAVEGEAALYGPKMDFIATDSMGREWQISTIQIDMNMPERFGLKYVDQDGSEKTPIMIHRAIIGSERFVGIVIEHFAGSFPAWLAPEQVRVIPISDDNNDYAEEIQNTLSKAGIRAEIDTNSERMQNKIRKAQEYKVPYMLILGKNEQEKKTVSIRQRDGKSINSIKIEDFISALKENVSERDFELDLKF